jgi:hypothetical protein
MFYQNRGRGRNAIFGTPHQNFNFLVLRFEPWIHYLLLLNFCFVRSLTTNKSLLPKCILQSSKSISIETGSFFCFNGNEVLTAKGETIACPFSMFIRYVELSGMNLDSNLYIFRPIFRSKGVKVNTCQIIISLNLVLVIKRIMHYN